MGLFLSDKNGFPGDMFLPLYRMVPNDVSMLIFVYENRQN